MLACQHVKFVTDAHMIKNRTPILRNGDRLITTITGAIILYSPGVSTVGVSLLLDEGKRYIWM